MHSIYMHGFDAWGGDLAVRDYVSACKASEKYKLGKWYYLDKNDEIVSSLIIYHQGFGLSDHYCGIGSISTNPIHRGKGYAQKLVSECIQILVQGKYLGIFLFSEIGDSLYSKLGFVQVPEYKDEGLMFLSINNGVYIGAPSYF